MNLGLKILGNVMQTEQTRVWTGEFGREYTNRNTFETIEDFNRFYVHRYGRSRDKINADWLKTVPRDARILEVGANVGYQLEALRRIGFRNLMGIDIQRNCINKAKSLHPQIDIVHAIASDIPFKDAYFDLVFTNNVLIHMAPHHLPLVLAEMYRVTRQWILGFEYYSPTLTEIQYRGHQALLWKADYASMFKSEFADLMSVREEIIDCLDDPGKQDKFYLLEKQPRI